MRGVLVLLLVVGTVALIVGARGALRTAEATHPYLLQGDFQWWAELKPWGDGDITYTLCGQSLGTPDGWGEGVEN